MFPNKSLSSEKAPTLFARLEYNKKQLVFISFLEKNN